jgi:pSer/pThr/pTyr-binding forkhead associated (FHA) protein
VEREEMGETPGADITSPLGLKVTILESGREVEVPLTKEVNIGRLHAASASLPDIDLTSDGGAEKGVSRRHVQITKRGCEVLVKDLGSMNGTFLNGSKLTPHLFRELGSGDELQLGRLVLQVSFTK